MAVTMTQIAKEAGVSLSLVSRLLRNDKTLKVAPATRRRVLEIHERLGGVQPRNATTTSRRPCQIMVPLNRRFASYDSRCLTTTSWGRSLQQVLAAQDGQLTFAYFDPKQQLSDLSRLMDMLGDSGGLLLLDGVVDQKLADMLAKRQFPHVSIASDDDRFEVNTVVADQFNAMRQVVSHLKELGHEEIGYLGPLSNRYPLLIASMVEQGLMMPADRVCGIQLSAAYAFEPLSRLRQQACEALLEWMEHHQLPTALHCHNDWIALGAIDALNRRGIQAGRDITVVGYDNIEQYEHDHPLGSPILTTVDNPLEEIGRRAGYRLLDQIEGRHTGIVHERLPTRLIVRSTSSPPRLSKQTAKGRAAISSC